MLLDRATRRLNNAIHACLDACYTASNPLDALAAFLADLRSHPDWDPVEIGKVEQAARRMLRSIVGRRHSDRLSPLTRLPARAG